MEIFAILGAAFPPRAPIGVKFCTAKQTNLLLDCAKLHMNRCNESRLRDENADLRPVSKFKYRLMPLRGVLPVNNNGEYLSASIIAVWLIVRLAKRI